MRKQILEELKDMRYLFNYDRGKIISEQDRSLNEMINLEKSSFGYLSGYSQLYLRDR